MDHPVKQSFWMEKISKISMVLHSSCWKSEAALPLSNNFLHFLQFLPGTVFSLIAIFPTPSPPMKNLFLPFQVRLLFLGKRSIFEEFNSSKSVWNRNHRAFVVQVPCSRLEYNDIGYFSWNQGMNGLKRLFFGNKQPIWSNGFHFVSISFPVVPELSLMWSQFYCMG